MIPPRYFPFTTPGFTLTVGARPLEPADRLIEVDAHYHNEVDQKLHLLAAHPNYYFQELPGTRDAQREAADVLAASTTAPLRSAPGHADAPLDRFGRTVQEDLLLLDSQLRLAAGQLCFANAWCLDEKLGQQITPIHHTVPGYEAQLATPVERLLERLKPGRPVWRVNWAIRPVDRLDLTSRHLPWLERMKHGRTLEDCWLRVERQTLSKLPRTGFVLFTIHTYQQHFLTLTPAQQTLTRAVLAHTPPETLRYKGIAFLAPSLTIRGL